jgi:hypothetical protein
VGFISVLLRGIADCRAALSISYGSTVEMSCPPYIVLLLLAYVFCWHWVFAIVLFYVYNCGHYYCCALLWGLISSIILTGVFGAILVLCQYLVLWHHENFFFILDSLLDFGFLFMFLIVVDIFYVLGMFSTSLVFLCCLLKKRGLSFVGARAYMT